MMNLWEHKRAEKNGANHKRMGQRPSDSKTIEFSPQGSSFTILNYFLTQIMVQKLGRFYYHREFFLDIINT